MTMPLNWPLADVEAQVAALGTGLQHPEDVVWDGRREVLFTGGDSGELYEVTLDGASRQILQLPAGSFLLGLALDESGDLYACDRGRGLLLRIDPDTGAVDALSRGVPDRPMHTPNSIACHPQGAMFVSDSGRWGDDAGVIYRVVPDGDTELWSRTAPRFTNGLCLSPDGTSLYIAESRGGSVWRVEIQRDGSAGETELVAQIPNSVPDGVAFDSQGTLYVACYRPDAIYWVDVNSRAFGTVVCDPTGMTLAAPTNIAFAGPALDLMVTANLGGYHLSALRVGRTGVERARRQGTGR